MVVVPGFPWNLCTKLTETLRQIKTTFPMNLEREVAHGRAVKKVSLCEDAYHKIR